eukprot:1294659-Rhodomonas_salina.1
MSLTPLQVGDRLLGRLDLSLLCLAFLDHATLLSKRVHDAVNSIIINFKYRYFPALVKRQASLAFPGTFNSAVHRHEKHAGETEDRRSGCYHGGKPCSTSKCEQRSMSSLLFV